MGFYGAAQIVQDLRRHGVEVRPVDVNHSHWDCTLEEAIRPAAAGRQRVKSLGVEESMPQVSGCPARALPRPGPPPPREGEVGPGRNGKEGQPARDEPGTNPRLALRLGLRMVQGLTAELAGRLVVARAQAPFRDLGDLSRRAALQAFERKRLAQAGALRALSGHRHRAYWESAGIEHALPLLDHHAEARETRVPLRPPSPVEDMLGDYATQGLSLERHPLSLVRAALARQRVRTSRELERATNGARLRHAGLVTVRQQPQTAHGVIFVTLEDETGQVNVVVWKHLAQRQRRVLLESVLMGVDGVLQESEGVRHLVAHRLHDFSALLPRMDSQSRDFH
jgi:error-prone DNA polymerase